MGAAIELHGVDKRFGAHHVLKGIDLHVPERSVFGFLGNNGAGKSTTIRLITGLLSADAGKVLVLGREIVRERVAVLRQIGCIVDSPSLYPNLTAREFLRIGCLIKRLPKAEIGRVLELVNLADTGATRVAQFSLGMKQRLALAHALLGSPRLLVLDEPSNGLDPHGIQEMRKLLKSLPEAAQCTVFLSSHQLDEVEKIVSHVALLKDGQLVSQAPIGQLMAAQMGVLAIEVADAGLAVELLQQCHYDAQQTDENHLEVRHVARQDADRLHATLIQAGTRLFESVYKQPGLEEWFLGATGGKVAP